MLSMTVNAEEGRPPPSPPRKDHTLTVCMVPPPEAPEVWKIVGDMRRQLKDPGYHRWPPHANLLYPFLVWKEEDELADIVEKLHEATRKCNPFSVRLDSLGTFGGKQRGVLWLHPNSKATPPEDANEQPLLLGLHQQLELAFPACKDQTKGGDFSPHMTLSHFENLDAALQAQETIQNGFPLPNPNLEFTLDRIYLLQRKGDKDQFLRVAEIGLGPDSTVEVLNPPRPFPDMPAEEEEWVYEERIKLKARRNGRSGRGNRRGGQRRQRSREPQVPDAPGVIAAKQAERKAKRERLEQERRLQEIEQTLEGGPSTTDATES